MGKGCDCAPASAAEFCRHTTITAATVTTNILLLCLHLLSYVDSKPVTPQGSSRLSTPHSDCRDITVLNQAAIWFSELYNPNVGAKLIPTHPRFCSSREPCPLHFSYWRNKGHGSRSQVKIWDSNESRRRVLGETHAKGVPKPCLGTVNC